MNTVQIGSHVSTNTDNRGIVAGIGEDSGMMTIGSGGLTEAGRNISVIFDNGIREIPEDLLTVSDEVATAEEIEAAKVAANTAKNEAMAQAQAYREKAQVKWDAFEAELAQRKPAWATSAIVAELRHNDSDMMTDYFASHTSRTVILAFSRHNRDLFAEMRKAAALFPETAHLGPNCGHFTVSAVFTKAVVTDHAHYWEGESSRWHESPDQVFTTKRDAMAWVDQKGEPETITIEGKEIGFDWLISEQKIEHREKYSMGRGYFLLDGHTDSSGWRVRKLGINNLSCSEFLPESVTTEPVDGVTVTENDEHNGVEIRFPGKPSEEIRTALKSNRFRWSRRNTCWYHKRTPQALEFANNLAS